MPAPIPLPARQRVYRALAAEFPFDQAIPMATVAKALMDAGVRKEEFGHTKLKPFLATLGDFLDFTDIVAGGVPQRLVTVRHRPDWDEPASSAAMGFATSPAGQAAATGKPSATEPDAAPHAPVVVPPVAPSKELEHFAWLGPWEDFLDQLADLALPEAWDFEAPEDPTGHRNAILKSFVCTTFYRLRLEDKVCTDAAARFAAFNTGLVNRRYDDIYACFEPDTTQSSFEWRFVGFCTAGSRGLGKRLVSLFCPLPEPASYFSSMDDLLFNLERELIVDFGHILIDNLERLPVAFLEEELHGDEEGAGLVRALRDASDDERVGALADLADLLSDDDRLFRRLRSRLKDAVEMARKRVRWNYKTAVPSYYPRANAMSLLLPLCLLDDEHADAALVVQLMPSGNYQGQTILTMRQAYTNARLICRPDSDWLQKE